MSPCPWQCPEGSCWVWAQVLCLSCELNSWRVKAQNNVPYSNLTAAQQSCAARADLSCKLHDPLRDCACTGCLTQRLSSLKTGMRTLPGRSKTPRTRSQRAGWMMSPRRSATLVLAQLILVSTRTACTRPSWCWTPATDGLLTSMPSASLSHLASAATATQAARSAQMSELALASRWPSL